MKTYLQHLSGFSRAQLTRLVLKCLLVGALRPTRARRNRFPAKYTNADKQLLALTDNAHGRVSGPATKRILEREYAIYGDKRFARAQGISVAIGIRRKPEPQGRPGYIRVDTVHQGDLGKKKGVCHVNLVDAVTQWEVVACVESISEAYLMPVLEAAPRAFPFVLLGFHSDNGSEYINLLERRSIAMQDGPIQGWRMTDDSNPEQPLSRFWGLARPDWRVRKHRRRRWTDEQCPESAGAVRQPHISPPDMRIQLEI